MGQARGNSPPGQMDGVQVPVNPVPLPPPVRVIVQQLPTKVTDAGLVEGGPPGQIPSIPALAVGNGSTVMEKDSEVAWQPHASITVTANSYSPDPWQGVKEVLIPVDGDRQTPELGDN